MNIQKYVPITKTDEEKQMVYGIASTPDLDSQGEVVSIEALKKALPDYMKFPTIREMHQAKAAGVTKQAEIKQEGMYIGAKVVDKDAWQKVKEGVYRGFSIGGRVRQKIDNVIKDLELTEISLVDRPANAKAVITVFKADMGEDEIINLGDVSTFMEIAMRLAFIKTARVDENKNTKYIDKAIKALKEAAIKALSEMDSKKVLEVFDMSKFELKHRAMDRSMVKFSTLNEDSNVYKFINKIREEVSQMANKADETKKDKKNQPEPEVKEEEVVDEVETEEVETEDPAQEVDQAEKADQPSDLTEDLLGRLEKIESSLEEEKEEAKVTKVEKLETGLVKVASVLEKLAERVTALEDQPAQPKAKASFVVKKLDDESESEDRLTQINKRLDELMAIRKKDLAKFQTDFQDEAFSLIDEKNLLTQ